MDSAEQRLVLLVELRGVEHTLLSAEGTGWGKDWRVEVSCTTSALPYVWSLADKTCRWVSMCPCGYGDC